MKRQCCQGNQLGGPRREHDPGCRGSLPGPCAPPAAQPILPDERSHLHRALRRALQLHARGEPALRRPRPGRDRRDPAPDPSVLTVRGAHGARRPKAPRSNCARAARKRCPARSRRPRVGVDTGAKMTRNAASMTALRHAGPADSTIRLSWPGGQFGLEARAGALGGSAVGAVKRRPRVTHHRPWMCNRDHIHPGRTGRPGRSSVGPTIRRHGRDDRTYQNGTGIEQAVDHAGLHLRGHTGQFTGCSRRRCADSD